MFSQDSGGGVSEINSAHLYSFGDAFKSIMIHSSSNYLKLNTSSLQHFNRSLKYTDLWFMLHSHGFRLQTEMLWSPASPTFTVQLSSTKMISGLTFTVCLTPWVQHESWQPWTSWKNTAVIWLAVSVFVAFQSLWCWCYLIWVYTSFLSSLRTVWSEHLTTFLCHRK